MSTLFACTILVLCQFASARHGEEFNTVCAIQHYELLSGGVPIPEGIPVFKQDGQMNLMGSGDYWREVLIGKGLIHRAAQFAFLMNVCIREKIHSIGINQLGPAWHGRTPWQHRKLSPVINSHGRGFPVIGADEIEIDENSRLHRGEVNNRERQIWTVFRLVVFRVLASVPKIKKELDRGEERQNEGISHYPSIGVQLSICAGLFLGGFLLLCWRFERFNYKRGLLGSSAEYCGFLLVGAGLILWFLFGFTHLWQ